MARTCCSVSGLCLHPAGTCPSSTAISDGGGDGVQKLTIFYKDQMQAIDATEVQARVIISMAKREAEDRQKDVYTGSHQQSPSGSMTYAGLSMKMSLQRFLQKRKARIGAAAPYKQHMQQHHHCVQQEKQQQQQQQQQQQPQLTIFL